MIKVINNYTGELGVIKIPHINTPAESETVANLVSYSPDMYKALETAETLFKGLKAQGKADLDFRFISELLTKIKG
jgi:hypothetical protein